MTTDAGLSDPYAHSGNRSTDRPKDLVDPYNPHDRPLRPEDLIERGPNGRPRLWAPDGKQRLYSRPSSFGKKGEDTTNLSKWTTRTTVSGFLDFGDQSRTLRMEWAATGPEDKDRRNDLCEQARRLVDQADRRGTAFHAITERYDHGLDVRCPDEVQEAFEAYKKIIENFEIVTLASGRKGIEVFVAVDIDREGKRTIRLAGTFDRLLRHAPCSNCGKRNRVGDLKSGNVEWGRQTMAVQLAIYANAQEYVPDGNGARRLDLPDVCLCTGFIINVRPDLPEASQVYWLDIASGWDYTTGLIPDIMDYRNHRNLMLPWTPVPDMWRLVDEAQTPTDVRALWARYPGAPWSENDGALTRYAAARVDQLTTG